MTLPRASTDRALLAPPQNALLSSRLRRLLSLDSSLSFILAGGLAYLALAAAALLALHPYFSRTWDVLTFIAAGRTFLDGSWLSLYALSRVTQTWPYAYPPLHALLVAPFLLLPFPDFIAARLPSLLADIAVGGLLYHILRRQTGSLALARAGLLLWLFNPITFYNTIVQAHFESEWLLGVLLAYWLASTRPGSLLSALCLALAVLDKQVALLFAPPLWLAALRPASAAPGQARVNWRGLAASLALFGGLVAVVSAPFLFASPDYLYLNVSYVASVPLQTQSWLVAVAGLAGSDSPLLAASTFFTLAAALAVALLAWRRGASLFLTGAWIALAFFLTSKKVMGYYYVMLLPFLLIELLPRGRARLIALTVAFLSWVSLSPYLASWADPTHWPFYALLGLLNSAFFLWLAFDLARDHLAFPPGTRIPAVTLVTPLAPTYKYMLLPPALFSFSLLAALGQPLIASTASPIRAPLVAPGLEAPALALAALVLSLSLLSLLALARLLHVSPRAGAWGLALIPLYLLTFNLTKESTAALESLLKSARF